MAASAVSCRMATLSAGRPAVNIPEKRWQLQRCPAEWLQCQLVSLLFPYFRRHHVGTRSQSESGQTGMNPYNQNKNAIITKHTYIFYFSWFIKMAIKDCKKVCKFSKFPLFVLLCFCTICFFLLLDLIWSFKGVLCFY